MKKQHIYFVSLAHNGTGNGGLGFANLETPRSEPITTLDQLNEIAKDLRKMLGVTSVVILNYQLLRIERK